MLRAWKSFLRKRKGLTLIEILTALGITAIIAPGIAISINQTIAVNSASVNRMEAIKQVENALLYINYDAQMAQTIQTSAGAGFPFTITYKEWNNTSLSVILGDMRPRATAMQLEQRRRRAVQLWRQGKSVRGVAQVVGAGRGSVWRWVQIYRQHGLPGLRSRPIPIT